MNLVALNLSQLEFAAWVEIVCFCLVRLVCLPSMLAAGAIPMVVQIGPRRMVLVCMILLGLGCMAPAANNIVHGVTDWGPPQLALGALGRGLRVVAVYLYIRTVTRERDGEGLWLALAGAGLLFMFMVQDK